MPLVRDIIILLRTDAPPSTPAPRIELPARASLSLPHLPPGNLLLLLFLFCFSFLCGVLILTAVSLQFIDLIAQFCSICLYKRIPVGRGQKAS